LDHTFHGNKLGSAPEPECLTEEQETYVRTYPAPKCATFPEKKKVQGNEQTPSSSETKLAVAQIQVIGRRLTVELDERRRREEGDGGEAQPEDELGRPPLGVPRVPAVVHLPRLHGGQEHHEEEELTQATVKGNKLFDRRNESLERNLPVVGCKEGYEAAEADAQHAFRSVAGARAVANLHPCTRTPHAGQESISRFA
jgi:hypothetical protein